MLPGETNEQQQNLINAEKAEYSENSPHSIIARPDSLQTTKMRHSKLKKERKHPVTTNRCALKGTEMFGSGDWSPAVTRSRQPFSLCPWSYSQSAYACQTCVTEFDIFVVTRGFVFGGGSFSYTVWSCWKRCGKIKALCSLKSGKMADLEQNDIVDAFSDDALRNVAFEVTCGTFLWCTWTTAQCTLR